MFHNHYTNHRLSTIQNGGFGLVELLVSFSILTLVLGTIMVRQDSFNGAVLLRNQAYEIALHAREVQMYAVSILGDAGDYRDIYGLYFDTTNATNRSGYKIYKDTTTGDLRYSDSEEFGVQGKLDQRFEIGDIRTIDSSGSSSDVDSISVVFQRPNFDAKFFNTIGALNNVSVLEIDVVLKSDNSKVRTIEITKTGQISVQDT